ncbi:MAG TPA: AAA family ATPase, partial [Chitinophagaceae bacterium]|nr:AAA family ATPase [Chitinophagaceae bacterium]
MTDAQAPRIVFVTGIGTGVGKTVVSAIVCESLRADYWKPVQSGLEGPTDSQIVSGLLQNGPTRVLPE